MCNFKEWVVGKIISVGSKTNKETRKYHDYLHHGKQTSIIKTLLILLYCSRVSTNKHFFFKLTLNCLICLRLWLGMWNTEFHQ